MIGSAAMIALELLELWAMGSTEEHMILGGNETYPLRNHCTLENFNLAWKIPLNFTCVDGELEPIGVPSIR